MLNVENIAKVYNGKIGCMCGCKGKYSYNEGTPREDWQGAVSVRSVKIITKKVLANPNAIWEDGMVYVEDRVANKIQAIFF